MDHTHNPTLPFQQTLPSSHIFQPDANHRYIPQPVHLLSHLTRLRSPLAPFTGPTNPRLASQTRLPHRHFCCHRFATYVRRVWLHVLRGERVRPNAPQKPRFLELDDCGVC